MNIDQIKDIQPDVKVHFYEKLCRHVVSCALKFKLNALIEIMRSTVGKVHSLMRQKCRGDTFGVAEVPAILHFNRLGIKYVDLYMIHSPVGGKNVETYKAIQELKKEGL